MSPGAEIKDVGLAAAALMVMWQFLAVAKVWLSTKVAGKLDETDSGRIKDIHQYTESNKDIMKDVKIGVLSSSFACAWSSKDKVDMFFHVLDENTKAVATLTNEIRKQNGRGK